MDSLTSPETLKIVLTAASAICVTFTVRWMARRLKQPDYPPGPPRLPFVGNLFQMPSSEQWEIFRQWGETYGDVVYASVFGSSVVVLNSHQACSDLLDKKSRIYSDRPSSVMTRLMGWEESPAMAPYGEVWRRTRRIISRNLSKDSVLKKFSGTQESDVRRYLSLLLTEPDKFFDNLRLVSGTSLMRSACGLNPEGGADPVIMSVLPQASECALDGMAPGKFLVNMLPALQHVPSWVPGTGWKKYVERGRELCSFVVNDPWNRALRMMENGDPGAPSLMSMGLESGEEPDSVKWASASMYIAGTDTTVATLRCFILSMILHPDVQHRAQKEIDAVVGTDRLPTIADRDKLPFTNSIMMEVMRWQPVTPLALPHRVTEDDVYRDWFIPGGSTVLANTWAMSRDPSVYEDPDLFKPSRFLPLFDKSFVNENTKPPFPPTNFIYGYGRRICAGMHYAEGMVFLTIASMLATFNITPSKNARGEDIIPELKFMSLLVREPAEFPCSISPRSKSAQLLVEREDENR